MVPSPYRQNTKATMGAIVARPSTDHPRRCPERVRVNRNHIPTPTQHEVPRLVHATSDGGRPVARRPPSTQNSVNAPSTPEMTSHACRRASSRRVGAGISPIEARMRLLRSSDSTKVLLFNGCRPPHAARLGGFEHGVAQGRGAAKNGHLQAG